MNFGKGLILTIPNLQNISAGWGLLHMWVERN